MRSGTVLQFSSEQFLAVDAPAEMHTNAQAMIEKRLRRIEGVMVEDSGERSTEVSIQEDGFDPSGLDEQLGQGIFHAEYDLSVHAHSGEVARDIINRLGIHDNSHFDPDAETLTIEADSLIALDVLDQTKDLMNEDRSIPPYSVKTNQAITPTDQPEVQTGPVQTNFPEPEGPDWYQDLSEQQQKTLRMRALEAEAQNKAQEMANDPDYAYKLAEDKIDGDPEYQRDLLGDEELPFDPNDNQGTESSGLSR